MMPLRLSGSLQLVQKTLDISFFELPESPIGAIAMAVTSLSTLMAFVYLGMNKNHANGVT